MLRCRVGGWQGGNVELGVESSLSAVVEDLWESEIGSISFRSRSPPRVTASAVNRQGDLTEPER